MAYIGREPLGGEVILINSIESQFNGVLTTFNLTRTVNGVTSAFYPISTEQLLVSLGGVIQRPDPTGDTGFRISFNTIIFAVAPVAGVSCFIISYGNLTDIGAPANNTVTTDKLVDGSVTPIKLSTGGPWWTTGGNVGIGTTTPNFIGVNSNSRCLSIVGDGTITNARGTLELRNPIADASGNTLGSIYFSGGSNVANYAEIRVVSSGSGGANGFGNELRFATKDDNGTTSNKMFLTSAGNLGIGTANPSSTVDVLGLQANTGSTSASVPTGTLRLAYDGGAVGGNYGSSLVFSQRWYSPDNSQVAVGQITGVKIAGDGNFGGGLAFFTSNGSGNDLAERLRITSTGDLILNNVTPTHSIQSGSIFLSKPVDQSGNPSRGICWSPTSDTHYIKIEPDIIDGLVVNGYSGVAFATGSKSNGTWAERARINGSGNVGIGTTNPLKKLDVRGEILVKNVLNTTGLSALMIGSSVTDANLTDLGVSIRTIVESDGGNAYGMQFFTQQSYLTSQTEKMRIVGNGNVGIGTTNPTNTLHVYGSNSSLIIANTSTGNAGVLIRYLNGETHGTNLLYNPNSAVTYLDNTYPVFAGTVYGDMYFRQNVAGTMTERITIKGYSGNVGIGTTNPTTKLHVNGEVKVGPELIVNNGVYSTVGNRILVGSDTLPYSYQDANQRPTIYLSGTYPEITLNGTSTSNIRHGPTLKFVHNGTGSQFVIGTNGSGTQLDIGYSSYSGDYNAHNGIDNYNGTTRFRLSSSGVQVGSISGTSEGSLDVVGSHINGAAAANWSGYTLGDTYCDLTISRRHSNSLDAILGYAAPSIDFRASNTGDEWSVGQIIGLVDPLSDGGHKGGLGFAVATGGQTNPTGRRTKGYAEIKAILNHTQMRMINDTRTVYGPNTTWGAYLSVGGNGDNSAAGVASMSTTNGNLHLDSANGTFATYLNWYGGTDGVFFGNGSTGQIGRLDGSGNFSATGTKSFKISHPLPEKSETHDLIHVAVESPQAENIYSGMIKLVNGVATVNLDEISGMTEGTFVLLNKKLRRFVTNESGWTPVKSNIYSNILTIEAQTSTCEDECFWMVIGQRSDIHMINSDMTDETGNMIVEPLKETSNPNQPN